MAKVHTTKGLIDRKLLHAKDIVSEEPNARVIATEWKLIDDPSGEIVRRDVTVSILAGLPLAGEAAELG